MRGSADGGSDHLARRGHRGHQPADSSDLEPRTRAPRADLLDQARSDAPGPVRARAGRTSPAAATARSSVFIGSGQVLVLGTQSSQLAVTARHARSGSAADRAAAAPVPTSTMTQFAHRRRARRHARLQARDARARARRSRPHRGRARLTLSTRRASQRHGPAGLARRRLLLRSARPQTFEAGTNAGTGAVSDDALRRGRAAIDELSAELRRHDLHAAAQPTTARSCR